MNKLYKIGQTAKMADVTVKTVRHYLKLGLISCSYVDKNTQYQYFNEDTINKIQKIKILKDLGFALKEIASFNENSYDDKIKESEHSYKLHKEKLYNLIKAKYNRPEKKEVFINDKKALGKWKFIAKALSIEDFYNGKTINSDDKNVNYLYFLKNGKGYDLFKSWTKNKIFLNNKDNLVLEYKIQDKLLFLSSSNPNDSVIEIYQNIDNITREDRDIEFIDNTNIPFESNKDVVGLWTAYDYVRCDKIDSYVPRKNSDNTYFLQSISFLPNGFCIINEQDLYFKKWSTNCIIDTKNKAVLPFKILKHENNTYLILTWKDKDYKYTGQYFWAYVLKKQ